VQKAYFFTLDLLGGEPAWQVLHGLPFAIAGVACTFGVVRAIIMNASKTPVMVPTIPRITSGLIDCSISTLQFNLPEDVES